MALRTVNEKITACLRAKGRPALRLVQTRPCRETIDSLEQLLDLARQGEVTGLAFVATQPGMRYITDVVGLCHEHPSFARGAAAFLSDQLAGLVHARDPEGRR